LPVREQREHVSSFSAVLSSEEPPGLSLLPFTALMGLVPCASSS
jgi:hypothetical protein